MHPDTPDDPIDFSALDANRFSGTEDRVVGGAMARIRAMSPAIEPRHVRVPGWWERLVVSLSATSRVALPLAAAVLVIATIAAARAPRMRPPSNRPNTIAQALGVPPVMERWVAGQPPSMGELWRLTAVRR
jgi:hypothetical protein